MVPGLLMTVMLCFAAKPERGRTCASNRCGNSRKIPQGTLHVSPGARDRGASMAAKMSAPALPGVAYFGKKSGWVAAMRTGFVMVFLLHK